MCCLCCQRFLFVRSLFVKTESCQIARSLFVLFVLFVLFGFVTLSLSNMCITPSCQIPRSLFVLFGCVIVFSTVDRDSCLDKTESCQIARSLSVLFVLFRIVTLSLSNMCIILSYQKSRVYRDLTRSCLEKMRLARSCEDRILSCRVTTESCFVVSLLFCLSCLSCREVGGWGRDPKKCTGRDWGMGSSTI